MYQTTIEDIFIMQILREFSDDSPDESKEFFLNSNFDGIIDTERVETKEFFLGKNWREINFKQLSEKIFFPGNLTDEGYAYYFPAILIAALFNDDYSNSTTLLAYVENKKPSIVLALSRLSEKNQDLVFKILYYLVVEECMSCEGLIKDNQIDSVRTFQLYIMNQREDRMFKSEAEELAKKEIQMAEIVSFILDYPLNELNGEILSKFDAYINGDLYLVNPNKEAWDTSPLVVCVLSENKYLTFQGNLPSIHKYPPKWVQKKLSDKKMIEYLKKHEKKR